MRLSTKKLLVAAPSAGTLMGSATGAFAYGGYDRDGHCHGDGRNDSLNNAGIAGEQEVRSGGARTVVTPVED